MLRRASLIRFPVNPGDVPPVKAARRMGLTLAEFEDVLPRLLERGFPKPDPDTGNFDLDAIDVWRKLRHRHLYDNLLHPEAAREANAVVWDRIARVHRG